MSLKTEDLKNTINNLDVIGIYRILRPTTAEYIFFSNAYGTFTKTIFWTIKQVSINLGILIHTK